MGQENTSERKINGVSGALGDIIKCSGPDAVEVFEENVASITYVIDGGGSVLEVGLHGFLEIPFKCVIDRVTLLADQDGTMTVDIWNDAYALFPPTVADTITAAAKPNLAGPADSYQDSGLVGWTKTIDAGDILAFNIDAVTVCKRVAICLKVHKV